MKGQDTLFSKNHDNWSTPKDLILKLEKEFGQFTFDPCPLRGENSEDGLKMDWKGLVFLNPPYSNIKEWIEKALFHFNRGDCKVIIILLPARTDTKWFHELVYKKIETRFLKGRLKFGDSKNSAPFPSMLLILTKKFNP